MKKGSSDLKWIIILLILLAVESVWLLSEMKLVHIPFLSEVKKQTGTVEAGYVMKAQQELKRRGPNSLIWESTNEKDILFYQDSILTLSQSSARLYLNDNTELQLSENTLVTLEEPEDKRNSEIRLRFSKGDLKARNPSASTTLFNDSWSVTLEKGSEVALSKEAGTYQFEVISGNATLKTAAGSENLSESKIIKLQENNEVQKIEKTKSIQWKESKPLRVYTFDEKAKVDLDWEGEAQGLILQRTGEDEKVQPLESLQQKAHIDLPVGSYHVRLKDKDGVSTSRAIEVWKAPKIYLKKPLPRDRLTVGETHEFIWTTDSGVKGYVIKIEDDNKNVKTENADHNYKKIKVEEEKNVKWKVEAVDDEGHRIPAFYESEIYFIDKPLPAPKVNPSKMKEGAFLNNWRLFKSLFLFAAHANTKKPEMLFDWEAVPQADFYVIEVSSHPDFIKPEVIEKVKVTEFFWDGYKAKKYYWRVAAGTTRGKMGLFSEPTEVKVEDLLVTRNQVAKNPKPETKPELQSDPKPKLKKSSEGAKPVAVKESSPPAVKETPPPQSAELVTPKPPMKSDESEEKMSSKQAWGLAWSPNYKIMNIKGEQNTAVKFTGGTAVGFQINYKTPDSGNHYYLLSAGYNQYLWKPKSESEFPFQSKLSVSDSRFYLLRGSRIHKRLLGLVVQDTVTPQRTSEETVQLKKESLVGVHIAWLQDSHLWRHGLFGASLSMGQNVKEAEVQYRMKWYFSEPSQTWRTYLGVLGQAMYQQNKSDSGYATRLNFLIGFDQF